MGLGLGLCLCVVSLSRNVGLVWKMINEQRGLKEGGDRTGGGRREKVVKRPIVMSF